MNSKNIIIAIGVLVTGFILYKLLLGFVLPITLFVSLGYVLKFLLKGPESNFEQDPSPISTNNRDSSSLQNIVEIKPIKVGNSTEKANPSANSNALDEEKSSEVDKPAKENESLDG
tara:strand:+ start:93 stop:440 length:348 start_codon:yes stop_codon:yes gene_type:complete